MILHDHGTYLAFLATSGSLAACQITFVELAIDCDSPQMVKSKYVVLFKILDMASLMCP